MQLSDEIVDLKLRNEVLTRQVKLLTSEWQTKQSSNVDKINDDNNDNQNNSDVAPKVKNAQNRNVLRRWDLIYENLNLICEKFSPFNEIGKANMVWFVHQLGTKPDSRFLSQFAIEVSQK